MALTSPLAVMAGAAFGCFGKLSTWFYLRRPTQLKAINADHGAQQHPAFVSLENAQAIHEHANSILFRFLLGELTGVLNQHGYVMTRDPMQRHDLLSDVKNDVTKAVLMKREKFLAPKQTTQSAEDSVAYMLSTGYAAGWMNALLKGCESQGWFIAKCSNAGEADDNEQVRTGQNAGAWPLQQIIIRIESSAEVLTRDLVRCLTRVSEDIQITPHPENDQNVTKKGHYGYTGTVNKELAVNYSILWQNCSAQPGFFPQDYGTDLPPFFEDERKQLKNLTGRHITLIIQGTRHTLSASMLACVGETITRISAGEFEGAEYDDDFGYAFICERHV